MSGSYIYLLMRLASRRIAIGRYNEEWLVVP
jgi:hypothetical protein